MGDEVDANDRDQPILALLHFIFDTHSLELAYLAALFNITEKFLVKNLTVFDKFEYYDDESFCKLKDEGPPLHWAIEEGNLELVKFFREYFDYNYHWTKRPRKHDMWDRFFGKMKRDAITLLSLAVQNNNLPIIKYLVEEKNHDISQIIERKPSFIRQLQVVSPFSLALYKERSEIVDWMLDYIKEKQIQEQKQEQINKYFWLRIICTLITNPRSKEQPWYYRYFFFFT